MSGTPADTGDVQRFSPTSGVVMGWVGVTLSLVAVVVVVASDWTLRGVRFAGVACLFGLLVWCFMLRPRVVVGHISLELRNAFSSWHVPLAAVRRVAVRAVTRVYTDERRYEGVAIGRPVRSMVRGRPVRRNGDPEPLRGHLDPDMMADFVTEQILYAADRARELGHDAGTPTRTWATPELVAAVLLVAGLVVSLLV